MKLTRDRWAAACLTAGVLGFVTSPLVFVLSGVLFKDFSPVFFCVTLPPLLLASGFLLSRFVTKPKSPVPPRWHLLALEALSWLIIGSFLTEVSSVNLTTGFERVGLVSCALLLAWVLWLPLTGLRLTRLEQRVARLPKKAQVIGLLTVLALAGYAAVAYFVTPQDFIG